MNYDFMNGKTYFIVKCGLLTALVTLGTLIAFPVPGTGGYLNTGDAFIHVSVYLAGGWSATAVAAVGSAVADIILGSAFFAPGTFVIKGCMAIAELLLLKICKREYLPVMLSGLVMPIGYCFYELLLSVMMPEWNAALAFGEIPWNMLQYAVGSVLGILLIKLSKRLNIKK